MKRIILAGMIATAISLSLTGVFSAAANSTTQKNENYTIEDIKNLQNFLLVRDTPDLSNKDYDLNDDGVWNVFDLCLMKHQYVKSQNTGKTLVVYYSLVLPDGADASASASRVIVDDTPYGTTEYMAKVIQEETGADLFQIQTVQEYPTEYREVTAQASEEKESGFRPELASHIDNMDEYDTIFIGYPNWWGDMPMALYSFFDEYDLAGKTIIPFNTHGGSGFSQTVQSITELEPDAAVSTDGLSLSRSAVSSSRETIVTWLNNLGYRKETDNPKILIAYLSYPLPDGVDANASASRVIVNGELYGSVEYMAKVIQKNTNADMFEIQPLESYGDDFNSVADRALEEQENNILPELSAHIENLDEYDTIFVGYPIWWYDMPQMMYSFFDEYDFTGKTIIPFSSHGGSGFSGSVQEIAELEPNASVSTDGLTISRTVMANSENTIVNWLETLGMKTDS